MSGQSDLPRELVDAGARCVPIDSNTMHRVAVEAEFETTQLHAMAAVNYGLDGTLPHRPVAAARSTVDRKLLATASFTNDSLRAGLP